MKKALLIFLVSMTANAAAELSFMPAQSDAQKSVKSNLESGDYSRALSKWNDAFTGSAFDATENGKATRLYLLAQNGLPASAIRQLMRSTQPGDLDPALLALWRPLINAYVAELSPGPGINASWMRLFSLNPPVIKSKAQIPGALARAMSIPNDDGSKPLALWNVATNAPAFGDVSNAQKALTALKSLKQNQVGADQITLATARVLYQKGDVDGAIDAYEAIPKSSDFWIQALEERAWAHLRKKEHDAAVNDITTLLSPAIAPLAGPEPYFLSELTSLQVCDYPKILRTSKQFKERQRERLVQLEQLSKTGNNKAVGAVMAGFDEYGFGWKAVSANLQWLPHDFMRDRIFSSNMKRRLELLTENRNASRLDDAPEAKGLTAENGDLAEKARAAATARLRTLATEELEEYRVTINKLHIVEAEVIQRLYIDERLKGKRKPVQQAKDDDDTIHFPYSDDEIWMDELDHYKSNVKACPGLPAGPTTASLKGSSL